MSTTYLEAIPKVLWEEMERDPDVFLIGEDIGRLRRGVQGQAGFLERFGEGAWWIRRCAKPASRARLCGAGLMV